MVYDALVARISAKSTHQVEREERASEKKAQEEAKKNDRKEAAAKARRETLEARRKELEEARLVALKKRTHKKRAAKKASKKMEQQGRISREPTVSTSLEDEASEELLRHIEEELAELGDGFASDETFYSSDEESEISMDQVATNTPTPPQPKTKAIPSLMSLSPQPPPMAQPSYQPLSSLSSIPSPIMTSSSNHTFPSSRNIAMAKHPMYSRKMNTTVDTKEPSAGENVTTSRTQNTSENIMFRDAIEESVQKAKKEEERRAAEETNRVQQTNIQELKERARKTKEFYLKVEDQAADALLKRTKLEHDLKKAETTERKTAEAALKAAERAAEVKEQAKEAALDLDSLREVAQTAKKKHRETEKALKVAEEAFDKEHAEETVVVGEANPLLDFLTETIETKSGELECPVCFEEAFSPIYSCHRGHLICSSCRPRVSDCPECRQPLGREWLRHRFAEKTAEELKRLRERRDSLL